MEGTTWFPPPLTFKKDIKMIRELKTKDLKNFIYFCQNKKVYSSTEEIKNEFSSFMKRSDKCFVKEEFGCIRGILTISEKEDGKYLSVFSNTRKDSDDLFQIFGWEKIYNIKIVANKRDKKYFYFNRKYKKLCLQFYLKRCGFYIEKDLGNKLLLVNKRREYGNNK